MVVCSRCQLFDQELIFCIVTHLVVLVGVNLFRKVEGSIISNWIGVKFGRNVLLLNMAQLIESDF